MDNIYKITFGDNDYYICLRCNGSPNYVSHLYNEACKKHDFNFIERIAVNDFVISKEDVEKLISINKFFENFLNGVLMKKVDMNFYQKRNMWHY